MNSTGFFISGLIVTVGVILFIVGYQESTHTGLFSKPDKVETVDMGKLIYKSITLTPVNQDNGGPVAECQKYEKDYTWRCEIWNSDGLRIKNVMDLTELNPVQMCFDGFDLGFPNCKEYLIYKELIAQHSQTSVTQP